MLEITCHKVTDLKSSNTRGRNNRAVMAMVLPLLSLLTNYIFKNLNQNDSWFAILHYVKPTYVLVAAAWQTWFLALFNHPES